MGHLHDLAVFLCPLFSRFYRLLSKPVPTMSIDSHKWEELQVLDCVGGGFREAHDPPGRLWENMSPGHTHKVCTSSITVAVHKRF